MFKASVLQLKWIPTGIGLKKSNEIQMKERYMQWVLHMFIAELVVRLVVVARQ